MTIETSIGRLNPQTGTVPVTFTSGPIVHRRAVNAVLTDDGKHDRAATMARVADVAHGVAHKIAIGAIK
jgi:hypothetical protein